MLIHLVLLLLLLFTYTSVCLLTRLRIVCLCVVSCAWLCLCLYMRKHTYIHPYIHTYIHTYIHDSAFQLWCMWLSWLKSGFGESRHSWTLNSLWAGTNGKIIFRTNSNSSKMERNVLYLYNVFLFKWQSMTFKMDGPEGNVD